MKSSKKSGSDIPKGYKINNQQPNPNKKKALKEAGGMPIIMPNQRYYTVQTQKETTAGKRSNRRPFKEGEHLSAAFQKDLTASMYSRAPSNSPMMRLKFGQRLNKRIEEEVEMKIAAAGGTTSVFSAGSSVSIGGIGGKETTVKKYTEEEFLRKFGTDKITDQFERPYDDIDYTRFHDAVRADGMTRLVFLKKGHYVIGEYSDIEFSPNYYIPKDEDRDQAQEDLNNNELLNSLKRELKKIDEKTDFYLTQHAILFHKDLYGQALIAIESDKTHHIPIALKILSGMRVGRLLKDKITWKIKGIEYLDYPVGEDNENILLTDDLIYVPNIDYGVGPNTLGYGLSAAETIAHISEQNVILNQMDMKEGARKYWSPSLFLSIINAESPEDITEVRDQLEQSQSVVTDLDGKAQVIDNVTNVLDLAEERDKNDAAIARYLDVPLVLAGFENSQIRAAASQVVFAWTQSSLLKERETLRMYIERQWYMRNLVLVIKRRLRRLGLLNRKIDEKTGKPIDEISREALAAQLDKKKKAQQKQQAQDLAERAKEDPSVDVNKKPIVEQPEIADTGEQKVSEDGIPIDENGEEIIPDLKSFTSITDFIPFLDHMEKLPFTIKETFEPISIDGLLEKAATVVSLKGSNIINNMYAWKLLKFKDLIANPPDDLVELEQKLNQMSTMFDPLSQARQPNYGNPYKRKSPKDKEKEKSTRKGEDQGSSNDLANLDIERIVTNRAQKPKARLQVNR